MSARYKYKFYGKNTELSQLYFQALQPNILQNKIGKFIPYIFMEWGQLPNNNMTCPHFNEWVLNFYTGGYRPVNPCKSFKTFSLITTTPFQQLWRQSLLRKEIECGILPGFTHQYNNWNHVNSPTPFIFILFVCQKIHNWKQNIDQRIAHKHNSFPIIDIIKVAKIKLVSSFCLS